MTVEDQLRAELMAQHDALARRDERIERLHTQLARLQGELEGQTRHSAQLLHELQICEHRATVAEQQLKARESASV